jgi:hypothetical protein
MSCRGGTSVGSQWMEMLVVDAGRRVGESLSTVPSTRERSKPAQLHQKTSSALHASQPYHRVAHRFSGSACELSTERLCALRAAARSLCCVPPPGGSAAQAAGLGEPSGAPPKLELRPHYSYRPYPDARLCVSERAQVLPRSPRDGPTAPVRRPRPPRSLPPTLPPSAASPPPAAVTRARCAPCAKNRTDACVHASQLP